LEHLQVLDNEPNLFPQKKTHIERDLIVAAAGGVELPSRGADFLAQTALDVHMDILVSRGEKKLSTVDLLFDGFQAVDNFPRVPRRDNPLPRKHFRMGNAAGDVVTVKP
jgi:hypothetical protein